MHLRELGTSEHRVHCDDASGELAKPTRGQPADEVLGEHGEALLGLLVTGQRRWPRSEAVDASR